MWLRNDVEFTSDMIGDYVGFVYIITDLTNNKKYVGKKLFESKRTLPPLKGKTRKRKVTKESDWMSYYGSSEELMLLVEANGAESFKREILHLCHSRGEMSYLEAKEQFDRGVLLSSDYYNGIINCKIHKSHVKRLASL
jgi:serine/threonine protein kinase